MLDPIDRLLAGYFLSDDPAEVLAAIDELAGASGGEVTSTEALHDRALFGVGAAGWAHIAAPMPLLHRALMPRIAERLGCTRKQLVDVAGYRATLQRDGTIQPWEPDLLATVRREPVPIPEQIGPRHLRARLTELGAAELMPDVVPITPPRWRGGSRDPQARAYDKLIAACGQLRRYVDTGTVALYRFKEPDVQAAFDRAQVVLRKELAVRAAPAPRSARLAPGATDQSLLEAVFASPADDAPRAAYADWLIERGDPRGTFIALQLAGAGSARMSRGESELLARHYEAWIAPLGDAVDRAVFRRGFLHTCRAVRGAERWIGNPMWSTVERLTTQLVPLIVHPGLRALRHLDTSFPTFAALCADHGALHGIESALVHMTSWPPRGWEAVAGSAALPRLSQLALLVRGSRAVASWRGLAGTPLLHRLTHVTLAGPLPGFDDLALADAIAVLGDHPRLQRIDLWFDRTWLRLGLNRRDDGIDVTLTMSRRMVEWLAMSEDAPELAERLVSTLTHVDDRHRLRIEARGHRWYGDALDRLAGSLRDRYGEAAALSAAE